MNFTHHISVVDSIHYIFLFKRCLRINENVGKIRTQNLATHSTAKL